MESRSSESNYGYPSMRSSTSESRNNFRPAPSLSSESAFESRPSEDYTQVRTNFGYSIREEESETRPQYNSLDDIDKLIERLEGSMNTTQITSERGNQILAQRKQKIELLKKLVAEARRMEAEQKMLEQLEKENSELDHAIDTLNRGFHR